MHRYLNEFATKRLKNYPDLLMNVITLPCETTCGKLFITTVMQALNVMRNWQLRTNTSQQMFKVFSFGFDMRIKTILPLINCLISDALLDSRPCQNRSFRHFSWISLYDASHWPPQNASFLGDLIGSFVLCVPGAPSWLSAKSLTVSMFSAVCDVRGVPLPSCQSVVSVSQFFLKIVQTAQMSSFLWKLVN